LWNSWNSARELDEQPVPTTTIEANDPIDPLSLEDSNLTCSSDAINISVVITNTSTTTLELTYVGLFPGGGWGHAGWDFPDWWPLPVLEPGETATHSAVMEISTSKPSEEMELFVSWVAGEASGNEPHPITCD
jgi:hypothetical protein